MTHPHFYKRLPFFRHQLNICKETGDYLLRFFGERIHEHEKDFNEEEVATDFLHAYMKEWRRRDQSGEHHYFS
jgi:hypothetical protein